MKKNTILFMMAYCALFFSQVSPAQIIHVPADYPTIQQGIDAANPGDTVLVADGLYYEQISFLGKKPLMVASNFILDNDESHIENTIIDGSQLTDLDHASVVYFTSGEDTTSVLCGFTITGGKGTYSVNRYGGGIYISGSGAKIIFNHITGNILDDTENVNGENVYGGGIGTRDDSWFTWVIIENNKIFDNSITSQYGYASGAGVFSVYNSRIGFNDIYENTSTNITQNGWATGGGISHVSITSMNKTMLVHHNKVHHNLASATAGIGTDGGVNIQFNKLLFFDNEVYENEGVTSGNMGGVGGLTIVGPVEGTQVCRNIFRDNISHNVGGAIHIENYNANPDPPQILISENYFISNEATRMGGALSIWDVPVMVENNVFSGNHVTDRGGAIVIVKSMTSLPEHLGTMINNSFFNNSCNNYGGAIYSNRSKPRIFNSIFYNNSAYIGGTEIYVNHPLDTLDIGYCLIDTTGIYGNFQNGGNLFDDDPEFTDFELLTIDPESPCIDAGTLAYTCHCGDLQLCPQIDILGISRPQSGGAEIGAYEMLFAGYRLNNPAATIASEINPNPCNDKTLISYLLESEQAISISLYDSRSRLVRVILQETQSKGSHALEINTDELSPGIYFLRISSADNRHASIVKMVKI